LDTDLQDRILKSSDINWDVGKALEILLENGPTNVGKDLDDWKVEKLEDGNAIFYKGKNYIPKDVELRRDIVKMHHDHETAGHPGELETYNLMKEQYWWPGMRMFIKNYVKGCAICQQIQN